MNDGLSETKGNEIEGQPGEVVIDKGSIVLFRSPTPSNGTHIMPAIVTNKFHGSPTEMLNLYVIPDCGTPHYETSVPRGGPDTDRSWFWPWEHDED